MAARYLIANWKMNLPPEGIDRWLSTVGGAEADGVTFVVAPPFPFLRDAVARRGRLGVAGQNCNDHPSGAFTGEVSPAMLRECGAEYVILGHSERRTLFYESDALVARKLALAVDAGLTPVLCIGEDLKVRDAGRVPQVLADQIKATAVAALERAREVVIAYEPVWAIGTGRNASGAMVAETLVEIRHALSRFWPSRSTPTPILYGGSVTPDNVADLVANGTIDGFLVGGASLDSGKFLSILRGLDAGSESGKNSRP
ncbi:MAG TPA: triose-phosphate isomerase [Thermoanaerobaculia bacterium]|nr:triose-phosphate isomerase [Thermoanaerobaculia bacterium]